MQLVDTHAHLDDPQLAAQLDQLLYTAASVGVVAVIAVGSTAASSATCVQLAAEHSMVYAAVGIQPNHCHQVQPGDWERIEQLAAAPRVVALGETGLDRYWNEVPFDLQQVYFDRHLRCSQQTGLPFIVHMRDCQADVLAMLDQARQRGPLRGVMHSYTGDAAGVTACVELGLHISFAGMVTYPKLQALRDVACRVPLERLLIETDSPYLSPHPHRGVRPNHPALVEHTARCLAEVRGMNVDELASHTTANARELFGV